MFIGSIPLGLACGALFYCFLKPMVRRYKVRRAKLREKRSAEIKARRQAEAEARAATTSPVRHEQ